eukprot:3695741-Amphidinium_carterae.1
MIIKFAPPQHRKLQALNLVVKVEDYVTWYAVEQVRLYLETDEGCVVAKAVTAFPSCCNKKDTRGYVATKRTRGVMLAMCCLNLSAGHGCGGWNIARKVSIAPYASAVKVRMSPEDFHLPLTLIESLQLIKLLRLWQERIHATIEVVRTSSKAMAAPQAA